MMGGRVTSLAVALLLLGGCTRWSEPQLIERANAYELYSGPSVAAERGPGAMIYSWEGAELHALAYQVPPPAPRAYDNHRHSFQHALTVGGDAVATAVFDSLEGSALRVARYVGGAWTSPQILSEAGDLPDVSADANGNVLAVWRDAGTVYSSRFSGGTWGDPMVVSEGANRVTSLDVESNASGEGVAGWCEVREDGAFVIAVMFDPSHGWGALQELGSVPSCVRPGWEGIPIRPQTIVAVGISDLAVAKVLWSDDTLYYSARAPTAGGGEYWRPPEALTSGGTVHNPRLACNANGQARVAYLLDAPGSTTRLETLYFSTDAASWVGRDTLYDHSAWNPEVAVGIDDAGRSMVGYADGLAHVARFNGTTRVETRAFGDTTSYEVDLAMHKTGLTYFTYVQEQHAIYAVRYSPN